MKANQRLFGKKMTGQQRYRKRIMTFFISLSLSRANEVLDKAITETKNFVVTGLMIIFISPKRKNDLVNQESQLTNYERFT